MDPIVNATSLIAATSTSLSAAPTSVTGTVVTTVILPSSTTLPDNGPPVHPGISPIVAFMIGFLIILLASIMNAAGLNLTKLDHVRMSSIPKAERRKDWQRPLWLLGMLLYIMSQLIGSTLALEYMRAEYVAPLGSSSLVFNFLFARFLVGTPVTRNDIWGTVVVVLGVIGIVAFGSINSGLSQETDATHLSALWKRGGWLGYFFAMGGALYLLVICTSCLDNVLAARGELEGRPATGARPTFGLAAPTRSRGGFVTRAVSFFRTLNAMWNWGISWLTDIIEHWASPKDDKLIAWTLGIGWACGGGGLAGACLVFAKATVKLLSGSLSHQNPGNQFGHAAPIFTIIFLVVCAVMQIVCLNRGLRVYDSTLVVPVFYGVYTATGFLNSLIFNNEVEAYQSWVLFLIFISIIILISGVVLLTHKKPEPITTRIRGATTPRSGVGSARRVGRRRSSHNLGDEENQNGMPGDRDEQWAVGEASDSEEEEDDTLHSKYRSPHRRNSAPNSAASRRPRSASGSLIPAVGDSEVTGLVTAEDEETDGDADVENSDPEAFSLKGKAKGKGKSGRRRSMDPFHDDAD
ncbi:hypothetical protein FA15DRAFT_638875 [Coprinopsis marcescibilis]|uniref:DUF803-domain-containing protein n=1 Tax=Coprinopsis marcescibilis TaxID=230819 RepID=A0A5C3KZN5_COPMA|nr:hypothetical protein FA15DRAFT_638875 [Coprinopsis marcescibilis]